MPNSSRSQTNVFEARRDKCCVANAREPVSFLISFNASAPFTFVGDLSASFAREIELFRACITSTRIPTRALTSLFRRYSSYLFRLEDPALRNDDANTKPAAKGVKPKFDDYSLLIMVALVRPRKREDARRRSRDNPRLLTLSRCQYLLPVSRSLLAPPTIESS